MVTTEQSTSEPNPVAGTDFGANEWLVEEMYEPEASEARRRPARVDDGL